MKVLTTAGLTKLIQLCKNAIPTVPVTDVTVGGTSVVSSGVAVVPAIPTVNDATLTIQKNGTSVATFTANASSNVTANISVPTTTNDLTNNSGFITSSDIPVTDVTVGGTSVVSSGVAVVPAIPTVNNSTITITQGGVTKGSFTLNQATGDTIALDAGGGGSVPDATDQVKGIAKLYNTSGSNTDGSMTQNAITNCIVNSINTREISEGTWIDIWFRSYWSGTRVYLEDIKNQSSTTYATYLSTLSDLYKNRSATMATLKIPYNSGRTCYLYLVDNNEYYFFLPKDGKRLRVYDDNGTIKFEEAMFKDFALMSDLPTVNDSTITITQGGVTKGSFTLNQATGDTIALDMGVSLDNTTITKNAYDNIQTIATINPNPASGRTNPIYDWVGTLAEYTAQDIETNHPDYVCFITDDFTAPTFDAYSKVQSDARYVQKAHEVIEFQAPTAQNNYTWYRKYADGWVEQGGKLDGFVNGSASWLNKTVSLPIQMADTNYSVIASDCGIGQNATHGTYNLPTSSTQWSYYYYNASDSRVVHWQVSGMYAQ